MGLLGEMKVVFSANTAGLLGGITSAQGAVQSFANSASKISPVAGIFAAVGVAAVGFGVASVKSAADFQQSMLKNMAYAGLNQKQYEQMSQSILTLSTQVGKAPKDLADGLYFVLSAGIPASQAMDTLSASARIAATSMTDTQTVASAMTSVMFAWGASSAQAADFMTKAVADGKFTMESFATSIGKVGSVAHTAGVDMNQAGAALDVLSYAFPSAAQASTGLQSLLTIMDIKTDTLAKRATKLGLSFDEAKFKTLDLAGQIAYLDKITGNNPGQLAAILGQKNALMAIQALSAGSQKYTQILGDMKNSQGAANAAFDTASQGYNMATQRLQASFEVLKVTVGSALLPILSKLMSGLAPLVAGFANLISASSPVSKAFQGMGNSWKGIIDNVDMSKIVTQFNGLIGAVQRFAPLGQGFLVMLNNLNNVVVTVAGYILQLGGVAMQILGQRLDAIRPVAAALMVGISKIAESVMNLVNAIGPVIVGIAQWLADSGLLSAGFVVLQVAITVITTVIAGLINAIASVINFFRQNQIAADALYASLVLLGIILAALAVGAIIAFLATVPALVAGFIAWAAAAAAAAIATIAATWPILLIVAIIIAVIAVVILAIQHWGEISAWLKGAWGNTVAFFAGLWKGIQAIFGGIGQWFQDKFKQAAAGVQAGFKNVQNFFGGIGQWFKDRGTDAANGSKSGLNQLTKVWNDTTKKVSDGILWLYNHNYYFKALCDFAVNTFNSAKASIIQIWTNITTWIDTEWSYLVTLVTVYWNLIYAYIQMYILLAQQYITQIWTSITNWLQAKWTEISVIALFVWTMISDKVHSVLVAMHDFTQSIIDAVVLFVQTKWNQLAGIANQAWQAVSTVFGNAWNQYIATPLNSFNTSMNNFWNAIIKTAATWGSNIIKAVAGGITSAAGVVGTAIHDSISTALSGMGFHDIPGFVGHANGITNSPIGHMAMVGERGPELMWIPRGSSIFPNGYTPPASSTGSVASSSIGGGGNQTFVFEMDGMTFAQLVGKYQDQYVRLKLPHGRTA